MPTEEEQLGLGANAPIVPTINQQELANAANLLQSVDNNNQSTITYDADTPYVEGTGYRLNKIDAPELDSAKQLKASRLAAAKKSKLGRHVSLATAGERAKLEAQLLEVEDKSINPLAGLGAQQVSFDDTQVAPEVVDLGSEGLLGYSRDIQFDASGKRVLNSNQGAAEELVRRGYAVPYNQQDESLNQLFQEAQSEGRGLFNPVSGDINAIADTADKRGADVTVDRPLVSDVAGSTLNQEDLANVEDPSESNFIDAAQAGTAGLYGKVQEGAGELLKWTGKNLGEQFDQESVSGFRTSVANSLKRAGTFLTKRGEYIKENANEYFGYDDSGSKMAKNVWGNLKEGKVLDALDSVSVDGTMGIIAQSAPEMVAYFNPVTLTATFAGNVAEAKKQAEEVNKGNEISDTRMAAILLGEGISMGLERFAIDKAVGVGQLNAKAAELAQKFLGKVPGDRVRAATKYALNKAKNIGIAAGAEGFQEVIQEGQRILTTELGQKEVLTEENLDKLGTAAVGGGIAGGGIRTGVEAGLTAKDLARPETVEAVTKAVKTGINSVQSGIEAVEQKVAKEGGTKTKQASKVLEETVEVDPIRSQALAIQELAGQADTIRAQLADMEEDSKEYKTWANRLIRLQNDISDKHKAFKEAVEAKEAGKTEAVEQFGSSDEALLAITRSDQTNLNLDELGTQLEASPATITKAKAVREALIDLDVDTVQQDVQKGDRGYLKYYDDLVKGIRDNDERVIDNSVSELTRFGNLQGSKSILLDNALAKTEEKLANLPESELQAISRRSRANSKSIKVDWGTRSARVYENDVAFYLLRGTKNGAYKIADASREAATAMRDLLTAENIETDVSDFFPTDLQRDARTVPAPTKPRKAKQTKTDNVTPEKRSEPREAPKASTEKITPKAKATRKALIESQERLDFLVERLDKNGIDQTTTASSNVVKSILASNLATPTVRKAIEDGDIETVFEEIGKVQDTLKKRIDGSTPKTATTPSVDKPTVDQVKEIIKNRVTAQPTEEEQQILANAKDDGILAQANKELVEEVKAEQAKRAKPSDDTVQVVEAEPRSATEVTVDETLESIQAIDEELAKYYDRLDTIKVKGQAIQKRIDRHREEVKRLEAKKNKARSLLTKSKKKIKAVPLRALRAKIKRIIDNLYDSINRFNNLISSQFERIENYKQVRKDLNKSKNDLFDKIREFENIKSELQKDISGTDFTKQTIENSHGANTSNSKVKVNPKQANSAFQEINLNKIVKVSTAKSILGAVDLASNEVSQRVRDYARKAYAGVRRVIYPLQKTREDFYHRDSLGRGLLFDKDGKVNANTATAIALSADEYLAFNRIALANNDIFSVGRMLGKQPEQVTTTELEFFRDRGILKKLVADSIGKAVMEKLGISSKKDIPEEVYSKLVSDVGQMGIFYLEGKGLLEPLSTPELNVPIEQYAKIAKESEEGITNRGATVPFVKLSAKGFDQAGGLVETVDSLNDDLGTESARRGIRFNKNKFDVEYEVKKNNVTDVPKESQATLNILANEEYALDYDGLDVIANVGIEKVMGLMGFKTDEQLEQLAYVDAQSAIAKNREIQASMDSLGDLNRTTTQKGNGFFFNWFFSRNGRFFLDSNTVNPQTDKLHRFLITPKSNVVEVDVESEESFNTFRLAIAQAFGVGIDKVSNETAYDVADIVLKTPVKELEKIFDGGEHILPDGTKIEIEEVGHTIQAIGAVKAYRARKSGRFNTNISFELDAVTSGFIIKLMQLPLIDDVDSWLAKGGVFTSQYSNYGNVEGTNKEIEEGLVDSYRTLASTASSADLTPSQDPFKLWEHLTPHLPTIIKDGNVTSEGRNLFKFPFMTFNYGASLNSIKESLAQDMIAELPQRMLDGRAPEMREALAKLGVNTTDAGLKEKDVLEAKLGGSKGKVTVGEALKNMLKETYGTEVEGVFNTLFPELTSANKIINESFMMMFRMYDVVYQDKLRDFKDTNNRLPSADEKIEIFRELVDIFPTVKAPFSQGTFDSVAIVDTVTTTGDTRYGNSQTYRRDGSSTSVAHVVKEFEEAIASGGVVPIHYIDGSMIGDVLNDGGILGVHDAVLPNLNNARKANERYNDNMYEMNKDYSLTQEITDSLGRIIKEVGEDIVDRAKPIDKRTLVGGKIVVIPQTPVDIQRDLVALNEAVKRGRDELFGKNMKIDHMTGMNAVIEKVVESPLETQLKDKVDTKTYKDIMAVMKKYKECKNGMS